VYVAAQRKLSKFPEATVDMASVWPHPLPKKIVITRAKFEQICDLAFERMKHPLRQVLHCCGLLHICSNLNLAKCLSVCTMTVPPAHAPAALALLLHIAHKSLHLSRQF
jgi:hypothetical protein